MKKTIILITVLICWRMAYSQQVTREEAINVAKTELKYTKGITVNITDVYQFDSNGHTLLYEVVSDRGINVLVTGNKLCLPVVGRYEVIDTNSIFGGTHNLPCGLKKFIQSYKEQVEYTFQTQGIESIHESEWYGLINHENVYSDRDIGNVEPLIKTHWGQGALNGGCCPAAYNYYTPSGEDCEHSLVGCVAVAMGQVMNYWKWPLFIIDNWQFDWCNMPERLDEDSENYDKELNAVARLLERCAKKANRRNGCNDSESNVYKAKKALDIFEYNDDSDHRWHMFHLRTWRDDLRDNIDHGWPVIYGASGLYDAEGLFPSHAFICDGYSSDGKFHFNWGWRGNYDGDFPLDSLSPNNHNYNLFCSALFDLYPQIETFFVCDTSIPLDTFYLLYNTFNPDSLGELYNITPRTFNTLKSASLISSTCFRTIPTGATAEYVAHKEIILQPGFTAEWGSDFTARIEPCDLCEVELLEMEVRVGEEPRGIDSTIAQRVLQRGDTTILLQLSLLRLHPNPASHTLTVTTPEKVRDIQVYDLSGRAVFRWYVASRTETEFVLDVGDIPAGSYILHVATADGKTHLGRFVKN